jgi:hypothetical protein
MKDIYSATTASGYDTREDVMRRNEKVSEEWGKRINSD